MSNHSSDFDETMRAQMQPEFIKRLRENSESLNEKLGKTHQHPEGRLTPQDEGAIKFAVGVKDGKVIIDYGTPVSWIGMPPEQAMELAQLLIKRAQSISKTMFTLKV